MFEYLMTTGQPVPPLLKRATVVRKMATGDHDLLIAALADKIDNSGSSVVDISLLLLWFAEISFDVMFLKYIWCCLLHV